MILRFLDLVEILNHIIFHNKKREDVLFSNFLFHRQNICASYIIKKVFYASITTLFELIFCMCAFEKPPLYDSHFTALKIQMVFNIFIVQYHSGYYTLICLTQFWKALSFRLYQGHFKILISWKILEVL